MEAKGSSKMHPGSLNGRLAFPDFLNLPNVAHGTFLSSVI